jgi:hypothetical protein
VGLDQKRVVALILKLAHGYPKVALQDPLLEDELEQIGKRRIAVVVQEREFAREGAPGCVRMIASVLGGEELPIRAALPGQNGQKLDRGVRAAKRGLTLVRSRFEHGRTQCHLRGRFLVRKAVGGFRQVGDDLRPGPRPSRLRDIEPLKARIDQLIARQAGLWISRVSSNHLSRPS